MKPCIYCGDPSHEATAPTTTCLAYLINHIKSTRQIVARINQFRDDDKMIKSERELYATINDVNLPK